MSTEQPTPSVDVDARIFAGLQAKVNEAKCHLLIAAWSTRGRWLNGGELHRRAGGHEGPHSMLALTGLVKDGSLEVDNKLRVRWCG